MNSSISLKFWCKIFRKSFSTKVNSIWHLLNSTTTALCCDKVSSYSSKDPRERGLVYQWSPLASPREKILWFTATWVQDHLVPLLDTYTQPAPKGFGNPKSNVGSDSGRWPSIFWTNVHYFFLWIPSTTFFFYLLNTKTPGEGMTGGVRANNKIKIKLLSTHFPKLPKK